MKTRGSRQAGFSIHEVLGAIAGGFALAVVTAGFVGRSGEENALAGAARQVLARVQSARLAAVTTSTTHRLVVAGAEELRLERWNRDRRQWSDAADVWSGGRSGHTLAAPTDIVFSGDGSADHYGAITVRDGEGNVRTVRVSRSGRARID